MANITDTELATLQQTFELLRNSPSQVQQSPEASAIVQKAVDAEQIIAGLINQSKNADAMAIGASACTVTKKSSALFSMFGLAPKYEPQPVVASVADKMISDWKAKKNKQLFEMFHITR